MFYGWVIVIAGLTISAIANGIRLSFGVFFKSIESDLGLSRAETSSVYSVYMVLCALAAFSGGWALDRWGPRTVTFFMGWFTGLSLWLTSHVDSLWQIYLTYGLFLSIGTGAVFTLVNSTATRWFIRKRGIAIGITSSEGQLGIIALAPVAAYLISNYDWRIALTWIAPFGCLIMVSLSLLLVKEPDKLGLTPDGLKPRVEKPVNDAPRESLSLRQAYGTSVFWLLFLIYFFLAFSVHLLIVHSIPHAIETGISAVDSALMVSIIGGGSICGRLVVGRVSDVTGRKFPAISCALLQVGALIWLLFADGIFTFYLFAAAFGFSWGGLSTLVIALAGDIFGLRSIGAIAGVLIAGWSLGGALGPAAGGIIFDTTGSYVAAFLMLAVVMLMAAIFVSAIRSLQI